jgi:hypothetical protein
MSELDLKFQSDVFFFNNNSTLPRRKTKRSKLEVTKSSLFRSQKFCIGKKYVTFRTKSFKVKFRGPIRIQHGAKDLIK